MRRVRIGLLCLYVITALAFVYRVMVFGSVDRVDRADVRVRAILEGIQLPEVTYRGLEAPEVGLRVWITETHVGMDNALTVRMRSPSDRARLVASLGDSWNDALPLVYPELVSLHNRDIVQALNREGIVPSLAARVRDIAEVESVLNGLNEKGPRKTVNLYVDRRTQMTALYNVAITLLRAGLYPNLVVQSPDGRVVMPIDGPPRGCGGPGFGTLERYEGAFHLNVRGYTSWCWNGDPSYKPLHVRRTPRETPPDPTVERFVHCVKQAWTPGTLISILGEVQPGQTVGDMVFAQATLLSLVNAEEDAKHEPLAYWRHTLRLTSRWQWDLQQRLSTGASSRREVEQAQEDAVRALEEAERAEQEGARGTQ